jgi:pimeloyl-ACP methyl ester carboxylesterase
VRTARLAAAALATALAFTAARADPVAVRHGGLTLNGNLESVSAGGLGDGVVVLVHGTLAHHGMEIMATLQALLRERDVNSLAVTLSLGRSGREGMYDCATPHTHRREDAVAEIGAWLDWLAARGAGPVVLAGHSNGGNQAARYAVAHPTRVAGLVLIAPSTFDAGRQAAAYERRYGVPLALVMDEARAAGEAAWLEDTGFLYCGQSRVTAGSFLSYYADDGLRDTPSLLTRIDLPTVVIAASADDTVPDVPARARAHLDDDTTLVVVEGADHFFRDLFAEDVADAIEALAGEVAR